MDATASPLSEAEKLRQRREARAAKILNRGNDRLNKITQLQRGGEPQKTPPPEPQPDKKVYQSPSYPRTPRESTPTLQTAPSHASATANFIGEDDPPEIDVSTLPQDPMFNNLLSQLGPPLGDQGGQPFAMPPGMDNLPPGLANLFGGAGATAQPVAPPDTTLKWWNILHLVAMLGVAFYALYLERIKEGSEGFVSRWAVLRTARPHRLSVFDDADDIVGMIPIVYYFLSIEVVLQTARILYQRGKPIPGSFIATIAANCSPPISTILNSIARYNIVLTSFLNDLAVLIFVIGLTVAISSWKS